jgi:hypothetical protein
MLSGYMITEAYGHSRAAEMSEPLVIIGDGMAAAKVDAGSPVAAFIALAALLRLASNQTPTPQLRLVERANEQSVPAEGANARRSQHETARCYITSMSVFVRGRRARRGVAVSAPRRA